jgi:hypothetical protein
MWPLSAVLEGKLAGILPEPELTRLETVAHWCQSYLFQEHADLGRAGPVCPWCPPSVARGHFYLMQEEVRFSDEASVVANLHRIRDQYLKMEPDSGPDLLLKTVLYVLSYTDQEPGPDELRDWMMRVHAAAKPGFLNRGLMLGEFFHNNSATGVRSDTFSPLRSPIPLFAIRSMVPPDILFLSDRRENAEAYFAKFGEDSTKYIRDILNISPKQVARSKVRSLMGCLHWHDLQRASIDGRDIITGALLKNWGQSELQRILDGDRASRPLVTVVVFQPRGLGREVKSESLEHIEWLWDTGHVLRQVAKAAGFIFRDGDGLVAVLSTTDPLEAQRVIRLCESIDYCGGNVGTVSGRARECIRPPCAEERKWEEAERTSGSALLESAYADLVSRQECA